MKEKEENASGDRFLLDARPRMIKSLSMVGGVIKDPSLRPLRTVLRNELKEASERGEKRKKERKGKKKRREKNRKNIAGVGPGSTEREEGRLRERKESERTCRSEDEATTRDQSDTKSTDVRSVLRSRARVPSARLCKRCTAVDDTDNFSEWPRSNVRRDREFTRALVN